MLRPSFVPPPQIRRLRYLTRYRADLVRGCTAEKQRAEKLPEDAQIKLSVVATDIFGVSGRDTPARGFADKAHRLSAHGPGCDFAGVLR
jgi:transposase